MVTTRNYIYAIIEKSNGSSKGSRIYDIFMLLTIILSVVPLAFWENYFIFDIIEIVTTTIFIVDYLLRWFTADLKLHKGKKSFWLYPVSFWAIIDLVSILPSFNIMGKGFKIVRTVRLLKLLRLLKALRYSNQILIIFDVLKKEGKILISVLVTSIIYILITALIMFNCEPHDINNPTFETYFDALYWATVTLTTVGYGDVCPVSDIGRFIGMLSALFGIAIIALPSGIITASYLNELKESKGEQLAEKLRKSFRRTFSRANDFHPFYYLVPRTVPVVNIQVKQGMDIKDIIDIAEKYPEFRLRNMATTIPESEKPEDRLVVEHFPLNRPYGCFIDRKSKITIVSPCSYSEAGIGNTAYYLALIGGFNYVSKELELDRNEPVSFFNIDLREEDKNRDLFIEDLKSLNNGEDNWFITLLSSSSSNECQLHFAHGQLKGNNTFDNNQNTTILSKDTYSSFYHDISTSMLVLFSIKCCQHDKYPHTSKNIGYHIGGGINTNTFTIRMAYSLTCWDDSRMNKVQTIAELIKKHLDENKEMPQPKELFTKGFGYDGANLTAKTNFNK